MTTFLVILGLAVIVIALVALVRGHLDWARISSRKVGSGVLIGGFVVLLAGGIAGAATTPSPTAAPAPTTTGVAPITTTSSAAPTTTTTTVPPTTTTVPPTTHTAPPTHTVHHTTKAAPPVVAPSCSASVSDSTPHHNETVDIVVHTTAGASVTATAHYKSKDTTHEESASGSTVDVPFDISTATYSHPVVVDVTVEAHGVTASCDTAFTPEP